MLRVIGTKGGYLITFKGRLMKDAKEAGNLPELLKQIGVGENVLFDWKAIDNLKNESIEG